MVTFLRLWCLSLWSLSLASASRAKLAGKTAAKPLAKTYFKASRRLMAPVAISRANSSKPRPLVGSSDTRCSFHCLKRCGRHTLPHHAHRFLSPYAIAPSFIAATVPKRQKSFGRARGTDSRVACLTMFESWTVPPHSSEILDSFGITITNTVRQRYILNKKAQYIPACHASGARDAG
jgi:hypothetical protein